MSMLIQITKKMNLTPSICGPCGGECCKTQPGATSPRQWGTTAEEMTQNLAAAFITGRWAVDWWEGDVDPNGDLDDVYFVRPHAVGYDAGTIFHGAGRNRQCNFLAKDGCTLKPEARPDGCLHLVPSISHRCELATGEHPKKKYVLEWRPYQDVIMAAAAAVNASKYDRETDQVGTWW